MAPPAGMPPPPASPAGARVYDDDFDKDIKNAEQATKHQYDARRKKWARTTVTVCIDKKPFAEGAMRQGLLFFRLLFFRLSHFLLPVLVRVTTGLNPNP